jgi:DNA-binding transcriptional MerR regulator
LPEILTENLATSIVAAMLLTKTATLVGLHPNTLRKLEKKGLIKPARDWNGWRRYSPEDIAVLRRLLRGETRVKK